MDNLTINVILWTGWPLLIISTFYIIQKAKVFSERLAGTVIGKIIWPSVFGWLFGMYSLGIVSSAFMLCGNWKYVVPPIFILFTIAIIIIMRIMKKLETEAIELQNFYKDLEKLVKQRTAELEEAHKKRIEKEKEIQQLKDQFVFIAAHELRTPVTAIRWGLETVIEEGKKELDPEMFDQLLSVQHSNERLIGLVEDLLNVARIESKTIRIVCKKFDLSKSIHQSIHDIKEEAKKKNITVKSNIEENIRVCADETRIRQVVMNLLSNAVKYNKDKGEVLVDLSEKDEEITIIVKDKGLGISKEGQKKLFTKFGRIQTESTAEIEGTGLGLFVSKEIAVQMQGDITVESEEGKGSIFTFRFPTDVKPTPVKKDNKK